jgi:hypothetical protein
MTTRKLAKEHIKYYIDKDNGTITAVCEDIRDVFHTITAYIERITNVYLSNLKYTGKTLKFSHTVRCAPEDEWNEEYGKRMAFNKLFDRKLKPLINNMIEKKISNIVHAENILVKLFTQPRYLMDFQKNNQTEATTKDFVSFYENAMRFKEVYKQVRKNKS